MSDILSLCEELISRPSVSPEDQGCQAVLAEQLEALGFYTETMPFGRVSNLWARLGESAPLVCFAGHTDVVPAGDTALWQSDPFRASLRDGYLYGRGAADMKGSLAAMLVACRQFLDNTPSFRGSIAFLITSDEESDAIDGTRRVMETLDARGESIDYSIVGEPSSSQSLGDVVRNGRRGSLNGHLTVRGKAGHVAYPDKALNPVHAFLPALTELCREEWDRGNDYFPATSMQISNIHAGEGTTNVIPGKLDVLFNFRFSTATDADELKRRSEVIFGRHFPDYHVEWQLSGNPFLTEAGELTAAVTDSIRQVTGTEATLSTGGGTSDGRFIAPYGAQVIELGPCNSTIHQVDECVRLADLEQLTLVYSAILSRLLT